MWLSLNSVLLQGRVHWPDFARLAAQIGFPGTDIMLRPAMQAGVSATNELLAGLKIRPAVIDFPVEFRKDDATFKASLSPARRGRPVRRRDPLPAHDHVHHAVERYANRRTAPNL